MTDILTNFISYHSEGFWSWVILSSAHEIFLSFLFFPTHTYGFTFSSCRFYQFTLSLSLFISVVCLWADLWHATVLVRYCSFSGDSDRYCTISVSQSVFRRLISHTHIHTTSPKSDQIFFKSLFAYAQAHTQEVCWKRILKILPDFLSFFFSYMILIFF